MLILHLHTVIIKQNKIVLVGGVSAVATIGERIASLRKDKGISQQELGNIIGVSQSSIKRYEENKICPNVEILTQCANYFEVSLDYLAGRTESLTNLSVEKQLNEGKIFKMLLERRIIKECLSPDSEVYKTIIKIIMKEFLSPDSESYKTIIRIIMKELLSPNSEGYNKLKEMIEDVFDENFYIME